MRILIIEDEVRLSETLADIVTRNNYIADISNDGKSGLDSALSGIYDAIILDLMLPRLSGLEVLRELRAAGSNIPVLILTAKGEVDDRVCGLDYGADYYLTKPFAESELLACLRAVTRRGSEIQPEVLSFADLSLNVTTSELSCGAHSVRLSAKELELLRLLIANKNILLAKETMYLKVWGYDSDTDDNIVEVYLSFLRKKLEHVGSKVKIVVVRMQGYRLEAGNA